MTRSYASARGARKLTRRLRSGRDPSITPLSFICFRLIPIDDPAPDEGAFAPIQVLHTKNTMGAFAFEKMQPWRKSRTRRAGATQAPVRRAS